MSIEKFNVRKSDIKLYSGYNCGGITLQNGTLVTIGDAKKGGALNCQYLKNHANVIRTSGVSGTWKSTVGNKLLNHSKMLDFYSNNIPKIKFKDVQFNEHSGVGLTENNELYVWGNSDLGGAFNLQKDNYFQISDVNKYFSGDRRNTERFLSEPLINIKVSHKHKIIQYLI